MQSLHAYFDSLGKTQREIAELLGVNEQHLNRVINGKTPLTDAFRGRFVETFGVQAYAEVFGNGTQKE